MAMEDSKRIRLVFKDDDILSEAQISDGMNRSWVLLKLQQHDTVSDVASHLLQAFQLHQSCPYGLILSMSGFVLPPFESTYLLKDSEIIRVRKRRDALAIEGNNVADAIGKLKAVEKQSVHNGVLLLANEEFVKEKRGYDNDNLVEESEYEVEDLLEGVEDSSDGNADRLNRKRKASEKLHGSKKKKQCLKDPGTVTKSVPVEKIENSRHGEVLTKHKSASQKELITDSNAEDDVEKHEESPASHDRSDVAMPSIKRGTEVQENGKVNEVTKIAPKEAKKVPSRSARRKYAKRRWMREMANIQKKNAACESEGLRNWKEDRAKSEKNKVEDSQSKGLKKWKKHRADAERAVVDDQPKGLLHWKQTPQNNERGGKKWKQLKQTGWLHEQQNQNGELQEQKNQNNDDVYEQPTQKNDDVHKQPTKDSNDAHEQPNQNSDASKLSVHDNDEDHEVVPIVIRPGHIRFEPFEREQNVELSHVTLETIKWNGITSKKKGQKWGLADSPSNPRRNSKNSNINYSEISTNEKAEQAGVGIDFDKLPTLPSVPKEGDLIAYRILELSSSWTPELSAFQVGKVSSYDAESNHTMLVPVSEYPVVSKKADEDESLPLNNSLYKEDGSLEIDFSALVDVRIIKDGSSGAGDVASNCVSKGSVDNENASKPAMPSNSDKEAVLPSTEEGGELNQGQETHPRAAEISVLNIWDQISEAVDAKKEQLSQESNWGKSPKLQLVPRNSNVKNAKNVKPSTGNSWGKNAKRAQLSKVNFQDTQTSGNKSWSYKALRGSALGPTMDILRSKKEI